MDVRAVEPERPTPGARDLLPILPIAAGVAWVVRWLEPDPWVGTWTWVGIAVAGAALIGLPALFWALDHGRSRLWPLASLGAVAGFLPLVVISVSGMVGLLARGGPAPLAYAIERGAPIPGMGVMVWRVFLGTELLAALVGAASACVYWLIFVSWKGGHPAA